MPPTTELRRRAEPLLEHPPLDRTPVPELRRRVRSRRVRKLASGLTIATTIAIIVVGIVFVAPRGDKERNIVARPPVQTRVGIPRGVTADAAAMQGQATLAFATKRAVILLSRGHAIALDHSAGACCVQLSRTGWVAYVAHRELWVARAEDGSAHRRLARGVGFVWSSDGKFVVALSASGVRVYEPARPGRAIRVARQRDIFGIASPAPGVSSGFSFTARASRGRNEPAPLLFVVDLSRLSNPTIRRIDYSLPGIELPFCIFFPNTPNVGGGLLLWPDEQCSGSSAMDGLPLTYVERSGASHVLGRTLLKDSWIAGAGDATGRVLVVTGGVRDRDAQRTLALCIPNAGTCQPLNSPDVSYVDPAWAPGGRQIAFVRTDAVEGLPPVDQREELYAHRQLWISDPDGANARPISPAGNGVADPRWTDASHLLFVRDGSLWLIDIGGGDPVKVAGPLPVDREFVLRGPYELTNEAWTDYFDTVNVG